MTIATAIWQAADAFIIVVSASTVGSLLATWISKRWVEHQQDRALRASKAAYRRLRDSVRRG